MELRRGGLGAERGGEGVSLPGGWGSCGPADPQHLAAANDGVNDGADASVAAANVPGADAASDAGLPNDAEAWDDAIPAPLVAAVTRNIEVNVVACVLSCQG